MTTNLNEFYGVTVYHAQKIGPRRWRARAQIFRRDISVVVDEFFAEGGAMSSADSNAMREARARFGHEDMPPDWKGRTGQVAGE